MIMSILYVRNYRRFKWKMIIYNYNNEESSNDMNSEKLQNLILNSVYKKSISQRDLARLSGISRNTLNDILNGKIKKSS